MLRRRIRACLRLWGCLGLGLAEWFKRSSACFIGRGLELRMDVLFEEKGDAYYTLQSYRLGDT